MYWIDVCNQILIFATLAMSLNLLLGYAGQVSVAHAAFAAIGGYASGYLALKSGVSVPLAFAIGILGAGLLGIVVSLPALLLSGEYMILLTLSVQTIVLIVITSIGALGGLYGLTGLPTVSFFGKELLRPEDWLVPLIIVNVVILGLLTWIGESPFGRILRGIRDDQLATQSLGKDVWVKKIIVFGLTSAIAGLGGALLAYYNGVTAPGLFEFNQSILIVTMVVVGGRGNLVGSILGAAVVIGAGPFFEKVINLSPETSALWRLIAFGVLLIVVLMLRPQGLLPEGLSIQALIRKLRSRSAVEEPVVAPAPVPASTPGNGTAPAGDGGEPILKVSDVRKSFGGIHAVNGLSFELPRGRVTGLIGPNGAGKTTVFNLLTGAITLDEGTVELRGEDITGWPIDRVARHGMVRSFQDVRIFPSLTVLDNVRMAVQQQRGESLRDLFLMPWSVVRDQRRTIRRAREKLGFVGLADKENQLAGSLPFGEQKLLALARILAADAEIFLLDEPASGIDAEWVDQMVEIIRRLADSGMTVCIVEHNLHVVERVADNVYFMDGGQIVAEGTMEDLVKAENLVEAYFGQP
ncbi:MAG TPA: branched-chain amino acid ABC transporter ATP-binding protein/permease [Solirubrobacterales bacterium]|nr:branched-chain amino acid ABC transporter ATP-binding protein/permease [Solirubrobacterales bacterium]